MFEFPKSGNKPVWSQGSRWINHKGKALQRVADCYGAYVSHLTVLAEDSSVKVEERARLKGYLKTWNNYSTIVGCAMYIVELGDIPQKNRKECILVIPVLKSSKNFIPANRHTVRISVYHQNTDIPLKYRYGHQHIYTNSLLFSQCAVYTGYCESERFFQLSTRI